MKVVSVKGEARSTRGKGNNARLRRQGKIPCVIYGKDQNISFQTEPMEVRDVIYTPEFRVAEIDIDGEKHNCIVKDVQYHPVTDNILHVDFLKLIDKQTLRVQVPVTFNGQPVGVAEGGNLIRKLRTVDIKCTPETLVDHLEVDIEDLEIGQSKKIRDINAVEGVEILNNPTIAVISVEVTRALKSAAAAGAFGEDGEPIEGAEGEGAEGGEGAAPEGATEDKSEGASK